MQGKLKWIPKTRNALLIIEFDADRQQEIAQKQTEFEDDIGQLKVSNGVISFTDTDKMNELWKLRKLGLGLLMADRQMNTPLPF